MKLEGTKKTTAKMKLSFFITNFINDTISCYFMIWYKNQHKNLFVLDRDDFLNVYIIEKAPNYLPLVKKCHYFHLH